VKVKVPVIAPGFAASFLSLVLVMSANAVRKDVSMTVDIRGISLADAQAVVAKAMNRVAWPP